MIGRLADYSRQFSSRGASELTWSRFNGVSFSRILWLSSVFWVLLFWRENSGLVRPQRRSLQSDWTLQCELSSAWEVPAIRQTQWHLWFSVILMISSVLMAVERCLHSTIHFIGATCHLFASKTSWQTLCRFQQFNHCLPFSCLLFLSHCYSCHSERPHCLKRAYF